MPAAWGGTVSLFPQAPSARRPQRSAAFVVFEFFKILMIVVVKGVYLFALVGHYYFSGFRICRKVG